MAELDGIVAQALLREAEERLPLGESMLEADWYAPAEYAPAWQERRAGARRAAVESLVFWAGVGMLGLAFAGLAVVLA
ncbi:hypothetical protein [Rhodobacter ferrooxidans]|nr:hypothetical protein [Rhodobacter sp. SW2]